MTSLHRKLSTLSILLQQGHAVQPDTVRRLDKLLDAALGQMRNGDPDWQPGKPHIKPVRASDALDALRVIEVGEGGPDEYNAVRAVLLRLGQTPDCCHAYGECGAAHRRIGECPQ